MLSIKEEYMYFRWNVRKQEIDSIIDNSCLDELFEQENYIELVDFKCLSCHAQQELEYDIVLECGNFNKDGYPTFFCTNCNKPKLVPLDVYDQITNDSYYPFVDSTL